jgi:hypothetical protein
MYISIGITDTHQCNREIAVIGSNIKNASAILDKRCYCPEPNACTHKHTTLPIVTIFEWLNVLNGSKKNISQRQLQCASVGT